MQSLSEELDRVRSADPLQHMIACNEQAHECCQDRVENDYSSEAPELESGFSGPAVKEARYFEGASL